ncbi:ATP-binding protein [Lysobacter korlensis]|uniref:histidine kinase n=1 Tax=Lysobacter korlensis TaxID=553636 RepID=A0ABV6RR26_9GAMM
MDPRVAALHRYCLLDTPREPGFDDLAMLAKEICDVPFAVINLVDADRQWFKAEIGFGVRELPLDDSICAKVMLEPDLIEIGDLRLDRRFECNPLVTSGPELRFYAGVPLLNSDGYVLGTLCVLDVEPKALTDAQRGCLSALGRQVVSQMELHRQGVESRAHAAQLARALQQRNAAEAQRRKAEASHRFVIDHALAGLVVHGSDGSVEFSNPMASEFLGASPEQLRGKALMDPGWHFLNDDGSPMAADEYPVAVVMRTLEPLRDYVVGVVRREGAEPVWALVNAYPELDEVGALGRIVASFVDITARKVAEQQLVLADRRKDEFLAMLAHELRNPLAPISTAAQLMQMSAGTDARVRQASDVIGRQVQHMTELVDDLLDVSRVTRGLVQLELATLDIRSVVGSAIEQVRPLIEARQHALSTWASAEPLLVRGDRTRLIQVIANLLNNAAKYTPRGGAIELRVDCDDRAVRVVVKDNGVGIERALLPHVFELFTQAERTPDRSQGGLGIGLALVRSIVQLHNGRVEVDSAGPDCGSTFTVCLPLSTREAPAADTAPPRAPCADEAGMRVLVVDDNTDAAAMLAMLLDVEGHTTAVAGSGAQALAIARRQPFDVFILDIGLPDTTGYRLASELRDVAASTDPLFLALTGYGQPHDRAASEEAGFADHLVKPVDGQRLLAMLSKFSAQRARGEQMEAQAPTG